MDIPRPTRYPIHGRAQVALPNQVVVAGYTIDISVGGLCILLDDRISLGVSCPLRFEMTVKGKVIVIAAQARSVYGVFASQGGFRAGFQFAEDDPQRTALIKSLAGKKPAGESTSKQPMPRGADTPANQTGPV